MLRLIVLVLLVLIVYWVIKAYARSLGNRKQPDAQLEEDMVQCAVCGVHLPKSESILAENHFYCSEEHRRIASR